MKRFDNHTIEKTRKKIKNVSKNSKFFKVLCRIVLTYELNQYMHHFWSLEYQILPLVVFLDNKTE